MPSQTPCDPAALVGALAQVLFEVLPSEYQTHCTLTATVARAALRRLGQDATVVPCQVWMGTPGHSYVVGFVGAEPQPGKWDGHVVCLCGNQLLDAALHHFRREFGLQAPQVSVAHLVGLPSQIIARQTLADGATLKWVHPPPGSSTDFDPPPAALVDDLAARLVNRLDGAHRP